jgi:hypothetical protein
MNSTRNPRRLAQALSQQLGQPFVAVTGTGWMPKGFAHSRHSSVARDAENSQPIQPRSSRTSHSPHGTRGREGITLILEPCCRARFPEFFYHRLDEGIDVRRSASPT